MKVRTTSGIGTQHLKPSGTGVSTDLEVLFLERDGDPARPQDPPPGACLPERAGDLSWMMEAISLRTPCIPVLRGSSYMSLTLGGVSPCDGVMVLDLGPPPEQEGVGSGPAPAQHLLSWHSLGTFAAGVNGEGGGSSHFTEEETEVREADGLAQLLFTLI